jgi:hypothetical protein
MTIYPHFCFSSRSYRHHNPNLRFWGQSEKLRFSALYARVSSMSEGQVFLRIFEMGLFLLMGHVDLKIFLTY